MAAEVVIAPVVARVTVEASPAEVRVAPQVSAVEVSTTQAAVTLSPTPVEVRVTATPSQVTVAPAGVPGPPGAPGDPGPAGQQELYDQDTAPVSPGDTYLRFERDVDGDVQAIYLGTVD